MNEQATNAVQIDELNLDKECIRLPSDYLKFATLSADKKRDADEAKNRLEVVEATITKRVRTDPAEYGIEKATEGAIRDAVQLSKEFKAATAELIKAKHDAELAQAVVWALEHKKRTLTLLVDLHGMGYFSNPKVSAAGREELDRMSKTRTRRPSRDED